MHSCACDRTLDKALTGTALSNSDILQLLALRDPNEVGKLYAAARRIRERHFGNSIFLYGFLYFSTYCRNHCSFCLYRANNPHGDRYRKDPAEILDDARRLAESGVHLVDLTMGEDPLYHENGMESFQPLVQLVADISRATDLPVMISPGVLSGPALTALRDAGAHWYACYQETHNRDLFRRLRPNQDYGTRFAGKENAHRAGLLIEEGILCQVGESDQDVVQSIRAMQALDADQVRVMNFVPQQGTPMAACMVSGTERELRIIAVMRLLLPDRLIPASLDVEGLDGLARRLDAGANVVTSLVPPGRGYRGVSQSSLDIDSARRTAAATRATLHELGLEPAPLAAYRTWISGRREHLGLHRP